jgi:hypothetical protein
LTRAEWELRHQIDPMDSLGQAQAMLQRALRASPTSASAHAMQGQSQVLEARIHPENRGWLLARAREHLEWSRRLNRTDREMARLQNWLKPI